MNRSRIFTIISLLTISVHILACGYYEPQSVDNMIYRLVENVDPYYNYIGEHELSYSKAQNPTAENLRLWREQTKTDISEDSLNWFVYESSPKELKNNKERTIAIFGDDGYNLLCIAKDCEKFIAYKYDPWYYPYKGDTLEKNIKNRLDEAKAYQGRYATRYALQVVRILNSLSEFEEAISYWEMHEKSLPRDILKEMAERNIARAYLHTGDKDKAIKIYAEQGDVKSLCDSGFEYNKAWDIVFEHCPNSPFFKHELQYLLTHLDNRFLERSYYSFDIDDIKPIIKFADKATKDKRVTDVAMWYYTKAALEDIIGQKAQSLATIKQGEKHCVEGSFLANSMKVLRIKIEAEISPYNTQYQAKLWNDLKWLNDKGLENLTPALKEELTTIANNSYYMNDMNAYYWSDVINRILVDVLAPRLKASGNMSETLLYTNLGHFWFARNVMENNPGVKIPTSRITTTMENWGDTCKASDIVKMYEHISHPTRAIDSLVARSGLADSVYWSDKIGTYYIAEHNYNEAVKWLENVNHEFQSAQPTWEYYDRNPFCYNIGYGSIMKKREHIKDKFDYKLKFAKEMSALEDKMKHEATADARGQAMIRYGIGLRNQKEYCWALSRYRDSSFNYYATKKDSSKHYEQFVDISDSKKAIDKGIDAIEDRELKAYYLHMFVRNKEIIDKYPETMAAQQLCTHCDLWRDYKRNQNLDF